ncbi:hypothetical protein OHT57_00525 [Streptomyces sp. NBC_00285]|uniref:hypothetical protein n=1 Tax=Streptomyces sp. NBC_00285 TaxID=2975700 RepID=UPI002E28FD99|nr:hypothetical protein [Streptomyces sp. NBC_00285]
MTVGGSYDPTAVDGAAMAAVDHDVQHPSTHESSSPVTFQDHLRNLATRAINSIPASQAQDIYVVSFFIDNERDDPRQPTLTIGYNTEAQFRLSIADASDEAEARWNYGVWCSFG